ncbi:MAG: hypothetical protein QME90_05715 [Thermodesulfobacteriota bacterium]|nr:hypothetical protein [Thermodesulfobacteriota bacterium]
MLIIIQLGLFNIQGMDLTGVYDGRDENCPVCGEEPTIQELIY